MQKQNNQQEREPVMYQETLSFNTITENIQNIPSLNQRQQSLGLQHIILGLVVLLLVIVTLASYTYKLNKSNQNLTQNLFEVSTKMKLEKQKFVQFSQDLESVKNRYVSELMAIKNSARQNPLFPKILWMYTEYNFTQEKMLEHLLGNFIVQKAKQSGLQVRFVDSWSVYKYLSNKTTEKITKTMQNMKIEESVNVLLRMALLIQHGGVVLNASKCLMVGNFDFLHKYFRFLKDQNFTFYNQVLLFGQYSQEKPKFVYQDYFIAAVKNSPLIIDTFQNLCEIISTGDLKFRNLKKAKRIREDVMSTYVPHITQYVFQSLIDIYSPVFYSLRIIPVDVTKFNSNQCRDNLVYLLRHNIDQYITTCGKPVHIIPFYNETTRIRVEDELQYQLTNDNLKADEKSYWYSWMTIKSNSRLYEPLAPRIPSFCLIDAHLEDDYQTIVTNFEKLKIQSYKNYTAIYFVGFITAEMQKYVKNQQQNGFNLTLIKDTGKVGRNYQIGIVKYCPNKSFVFILRRNQFLPDYDSLKNLANQIAPRGILGAFVGVHYNGKTTLTNQTYTDYNKFQYNAKNPKFNDLETIVNHLRVFHSDCYKIIPQFNIATPTGEYFNDRLNFLEHFLYMVQNLTKKHDETQIPHRQRVKWFIKINNHLFDVPNRILSLHNVVVMTTKWDKIDLQDLKYNYYKLQPYAMTYNMDHFVRNGIPMEQFAVYNPGIQYEPYTQRNKPQLIPKLFHIIWIDGELPLTKKLVLQLNKLRYPDFEFKVWSVHNITRQMFPLSYELLMTLYNVQKTSRYSKRATMADVYRHEILYNEGGIYMDSSMLLFNYELSKMLSYKLFLATQRTYRHRWSQSMCMFAVMPKFKPLLRQILPFNTNHYNIFLRDALEIAGPNEFRWLVRGMQQYDPDYLIMDYDTFYPMAYDIEHNYYQTFCYIQPELLRPNEQIFYRFESAKKVMPMYCGNYYPYSFGKEINNFGGTWELPRW